MGPIILPALFPLISLSMGRTEQISLFIVLMVLTSIATIVSFLFAIGVVIDWITVRMIGQPKWIEVGVSLAIVFGIAAVYIAIGVAGCSLI